MTLDSKFSQPENGTVLPEIDNRDFGASTSSRWHITILSNDTLPDPSNSDRAPFNSPPMSQSQLVDAGTSIAFSATIREDESAWWECEFCSQAFSQLRDAAIHEARCALNPSIQLFPNTGGLLETFEIHGLKRRLSPVLETSLETKVSPVPDPSNNLMASKTQLFGCDETTPRILQHESSLIHSFPSPAIVYGDDKDVSVVASVITCNQQMQNGLASAEHSAVLNTGGMLPHLRLQPLMPTPFRAGSPGTRTLRHKKDMTEEQIPRVCSASIACQTDDISPPVLISIRTHNETVGVVQTVGEAHILPADFTFGNEKSAGKRIREILDQLQQLELSAMAQASLIDSRPDGTSCEEVHSKQFHSPQSETHTIAAAGSQAIWCGEAPHQKGVAACSVSIEKEVETALQTSPEQQPSHQLMILSPTFEKQRNRTSPLPEAHLIQAASPQDGNLTCIAASAHAPSQCGTEATAIDESRHGGVEGKEELREVLARLGHAEYALQRCSRRAAKEHARQGAQRREMLARIAGAVQGACHDEASTPGSSLWLANMAATALRLRATAAQLSASDATSPSRADGDRPEVEHRLLTVASVCDRSGWIGADRHQGCGANSSAAAQEGHAAHGLIAAPRLGDTSGQCCDNRVCGSDLEAFESACFGASSGLLLLGISGADGESSSPCYHGDAAADFIKGRELLGGDVDSGAGWG